MQGRCGDYCGNMGGIEQHTMVGSTGKGVGSSGGGSAGMDGTFVTGSLVNPPSLVLQYVDT